jgi:hypothetical protein
MDQAVRADAAAQVHAHMQTRPGFIIIGRHGRPRGDRRTPIGWRAYKEWWAEYDRAGLSDGQVPPPGLLKAAAAADAIFSSTLPRSIETAVAIAGGKPIVTDAVFIEAPLPPPPIWGKRTPRHWGVLARIAWWLGRADGEESRGEAELRAHAAAATLTARALRGENVVLMAHGWFNRMMRTVLRQSGWRCVEDGGDAYWSFRRYEYRK